MSIFDDIIIVSKPQLQNIVLRKLNKYFLFDSVAVNMPQQDNIVNSI